jgi:predicted O-linked N-acetylglucosamine transferase (SPINDLY family)
MTPPGAGHIKRGRLTLTGTLAEAIALHQGLKGSEAGRLCQAILAAGAEKFDALHYFGVLEAQRGRYEEADCLLSHALAINPRSAEACLNHGNVLNSLTRGEEALASLDRALEINPGYAQALNSRGAVLLDLKRPEEALASLDRALAAEPDYAEALNNRGNALRDLKRPEEALACNARALAFRPDYVEALNNRGNILLDLKQPGAALESYDRALAISPGFADAHMNRGNALRDLGRYQEALECYGQALAIRPDYVEALNNRGNILLDLKQPGAALESYDRALAISPGFADAHMNRGTALRDLGQHGEALESFDRALAIRPDFADAILNRGIALQELGRYEEAGVAYQRLLDVQPSYDYARGHLLHARQHCCDWARFDDGIARITRDALDGKRAARPFEFLVASGSAADQLQCSRMYVADKYPAAPQPAWRGERYDHNRIRVAYLSADFHVHATALLMAGLFEAHDKTRFETTAISFGPDISDEMRTRLLAAFDRFIDVRNKSGYEVATLLRELEIDIAVDLKGYTANCRPEILSRRAAPIQVNYLGYPGTMGADYIDYILADRFVIPEQHHPYYTEKVVYLPDTYQVNDLKRQIADRTPTRAEAGLPERGFVFCSFNNNYKITPGIFDIWMRLLHRTEGGVLWLLEDNAAAARNLRREAQHRGVAPQRLVFAPRLKPDEHLARHRLADLFLDTLPYNAHTTASDALWAGLPVLTCLGTAFAGRVAASLLHAIGLPELVTHTLEQYEELAVQLAHDERLLTGIVARLAQNRTTRPLFNTDRFRRHIEAAYVAMWERNQRGEPPASFSVPAIS